MADKELQQIDRRIADTLEELRILRVQSDQNREKALDAVRIQHEAEMAAIRRGRIESLERHKQWQEEWREHQVELQAMRQTSDMQTAELRQVSATNQIQTDALRVVLERMDDGRRGRG